MKKAKSNNYNRGSKNPAPINGQAALDNSIPILDSNRHRIGISENQIVVLNQTRIREYHGHVLTWNQLTSDPGMQKTVTELIKCGYVSKKGKIL